MRDTKDKIYQAIINVVALEATSALKKCIKKIGDWANEK